MIDAAPTPNIDISALRERERQDLSVRVDSAFEHREKEKKRWFWQKKEDPLLERRQYAAELKKKLQAGTHPEDIIVEYVQPGEPLLTASEAAVEDPHEYGRLLTLAFRKMGEMRGKPIPEEKIEKLVERCLRHEFAHYAVLLGQEGVTKLLCAFRVVESAKGTIGVQPFIAIEGKVNLWVFYDSLTNPEELSPGDLADVDGLTVEDFQNFKQSA